MGFEGVREPITINPTLLLTINPTFEVQKDFQKKRKGWVGEIQLRSVSIYSMFSGYVEAEGTPTSY